jgi:hypothetical protein
MQRSLNDTCSSSTVPTSQVAQVAHAKLAVTATLKSMGFVSKFESTKARSRRPPGGLASFPRLKLV